MESQTTEEQALIKQRISYAVKLMKNKRSYVQIKQLLIDEGLDEIGAKHTIEQAVKEIKAEHKQVAKKDIKYGVILVVVGVLITWASYFYASSSPGGGMFIMAWGPVIFGGLRLAKGIINVF